MRKNQMVALALLFCSCFNTSSQIQTATITLDANKTYQTITGWEATAEAGREFASSFPFYAAHLLDLAAYDLGINRLRVGIHSGTENSRNYWADLKAGKITEKEWRSVRYSTVNDNDNPLEMNVQGFHFSRFDSAMEKIVLPLKKRVEAKNERFFLNVNYVAFTRQIGSGLHYIHDRPEEYAEFVLATYLHMQRKYNCTPDGWEILLEPDNVPEWNGRLLGQAVAAASERLKSKGFTPRFIGPSTSSMRAAITYFDAMMSVPGTAPNLIEFSYHRYKHVSANNLHSIAAKAKQFGLDTAMLEHIGSGYKDLHQDLKQGQNSAWQQYTLAFPGTSVNDRGGRYYTIDESDPANPQVQIASRTKFLRQYFKYIRPGAKRIEASTNDNGFDPIAFINSDGGYVVVVKAEKGGSFSVLGLPAGDYGIQYTTADQYDVHLKDANVVSQNTVHANIPAAGVITIFRRRPDTD